MIWERQSCLAQCLNRTRPPWQIGWACRQKSHGSLVTLMQSLELTAGDITNDPRPASPHLGLRVRLFCGVYQWCDPKCTDTCAGSLELACCKPPTRRPLGFKSKMFLAKWHRGQKCHWNQSSSSVQRFEGEHLSPSLGGSYPNNISQLWVTRGNHLKLNENLIPEPSIEDKSQSFRCGWSKCPLKKYVCIYVYMHLYIYSIYIYILYIYI